MAGQHNAHSTLNMHEYQTQGLSCPEGGNFWVCADKPTQFIGCCISNPCETDYGVCSDEDITPASVDVDVFGEVPQQACISDNSQVKWYTCSGTTPPFIGCCAVNACSQGGCPGGSLRAARLSDVGDNADKFLECVTVSTTGVRTLSTSTRTAKPTKTSTSTTTSSTTPSATPRCIGDRILTFQTITMSFVVLIAFAFLLICWRMWAMYQAESRLPPTSNAPGGPERRYISRRDTERHSPERHSPERHSPERHSPERETRPDLSRQMYELDSEHCVSATEASQPQEIRRTGFDYLDPDVARTVSARTSVEQQREGIN
ncbi:hypothetical protein EDB81DRAFT_935167 [Dactylonectria macrodidyma]|uniref:Uncharacterized protein n=1 Tax=Dactylonectria macrodidyma TaxID=307937 RepID=A0A9P9ESX3_9HYPO|nr:hypothetical protein EDB81DRAFT_935167 [Dactylonectria macrodidyma]